MLEIRNLRLLILGILLFGCHLAYAQINWMGFEALEDSLSVKPKKTFVYFYADWCAYCKKMDKAAFSNKDVIKDLNSNYYAVKMDAESQDTILFGGKEFTNKELGEKRNPTHEIALLLGSRAQVPFSLPVIIVLDEKFQVIERYFEYLSPKKMKGVLKI